MARAVRNLITAVAATASLSFGSDAAATRIGPREVLPACQLPTPGPRDRILVHHARTRIVSDVALVTPDDVTHVANIIIEPGGAPLYLLLVSSEPTIWNVTGATRRITKAVLVGRYARGTQIVGAGAIGVRDSAIVLHAMCNGVPEIAAPRDTPYMVRMMGILTPLLGREPEIVSPSEEGFSITLPTGRVAALQPAVARAPRGFDHSEWRQVVRFHRGRLARIDPSRVVGAAAMHYDVLPQEFGLAQLVANGALQRMPSPRPYHRVYRLRRAIARLPAGLYGAHLVKFEVPASVPRPTGDLAHSCLAMLASDTEEGAGCQSFGPQ